MYGVGYADIVVSHHLAKYLVVEVKRPGMLFPGRQALENAIDQARRYAGEQKIPSVAATDGRYLYAADVRDGGLVDRNMVDLSSPHAPVELWNLSMHGIYRAPSGSVGTVPILTESIESNGTGAARGAPPSEVQAAGVVLRICPGCQAADHMEAAISFGGRCS
jgi:hypothetical protein